jgi:anaerobic selenocysteine-containing dehydrogenase
LQAEPTRRESSTPTGEQIVRQEEKTATTHLSRRDKLSRRDALKVAALTSAAAATLGGIASQVTNALPPAYSQVSAATLMATPSGEQIVRTACALCPSGCGLDVRVVGGRAVKVEGNALHPLNQGVCCLKGQLSLEVLNSPERIQRPRLQRGERGSGDWQEISWDEALSMLGGRLSQLRAAGQSHTVALLHGELRGQMRATVERFMTAYGSPNLISRDSLGEAAVRTATLLTQGVNQLPVYDLNNANYVLTFGGNLLESSRNVIVYLAAVAFMRRGRPQRGKLVAIHPRLSLTGIKADEWVPIRPGTYAALALGMANVIINSELYDQDFVRDFTYGFEDFKDEQGRTHTGFKNLVLKEYTLARVSEITGVPTDVIARLGGEFATNRPAVAIPPAEAGELSSGNALYTAMAIHALNALVGSIDAPGGVMVQRFPEMLPWPEYSPDAAAQAGLAHERLDAAGTQQFPLAASIYQNVAPRILQGQPYPLNLLILLNANPVYDIPNNGEMVRALMKVPFVVSFASTLDESAAHADLILPSSTFMEVWGDDYMEGVGYAGVSLRRPVVETPHDTRNPGDVLLELASRLGGPMASALPWKDYQELIRYRLGEFDWAKLEANGNWAEMIYFHAKPGSPAWGQVVGRDRLNAPQDGRFDLFSRELFAILPGQNDHAYLPHFEVPAALAGSDAIAYPFLLVSQSLITQSTQWQGIVPTLQESYGLLTHTKWMSWVEMNEQTAAGLGLHDDDLVWVESAQGKLQAVVRIYPGLWPNAVFMPPGLGHHTRVRWGRGSPEQAVVGVNPAQLAQVSSEPLNGLAITSPTRVKIYPA